jgi:hypothetical protein
MKLVFILIILSKYLTCQAQLTSALRKATVTPANIDSIIATEKSFSMHYSTPPPDGINWFEYKKGKINILIIAPHATAQTREGRIKQADAGTGSLALALNKLKDVSILYTTYLSPSDPNFYDNNTFKDSLAGILKSTNPKFVIDLHGSDSYRPYDVDFGTLNGKSLLQMGTMLDTLVNELRDCGIQSLSKDYFPAEKSQTDTKFVFNKGIPCIQLEINSVYLSAGRGDLYGQKTAQLLQALLRFLESLANE